MCLREGRMPKQALGSGGLKRLGTGFGELTGDQL